jgi:hypothetical protein
LENARRNANHSEDRKTKAKPKSEDPDGTMSEGPKQRALNLTFLLQYKSRALSSRARNRHRVRALDGGASERRGRGPTRTRVVFFLRIELTVP